MKAEDYIKQYSDLLIYPKETIELTDRFSAYRIDFIHTCVIYVFSFTENVENTVESVIKRYKIDIDNQNKFRKIVNSVCRKAQLIPTNIGMTVKSDLYRAIQTDDSFLYLQKLLEDDLQLETHTFDDIFKDKVLKRSIENAIKNNSDNTIAKPIPDNFLNKLQEQGFIENAAARPLKWLKSKSLLAYFVEVANDELNLKNGEKRQIKPFETLFKMSGLTSAINDYKKTGALPVGYKDIDKLFS